MPASDDDPLASAKPAPLPRLVDGVDFYLTDDGYMVFTAHYLLKRGFCCESGCRHCPYGFEGTKSGR